MPFCKDCKHLQLDTSWNTFLFRKPTELSWKYARCIRPTSINPVTGLPTSNHYYADVERKYKINSCGPDGIYFEPKVDS